MKLVIPIVLLAISTSVESATWYARPGVYDSWTGTYPNHPVPRASVYGSQDGTSYVNAWNGITSINWGSVGANDTVYICGQHIYTFSNNTYSTFQALEPVTNSYVTIRGDYAGDPGVIFGGSFDRYKTYTWDGPDANGVYWATNGWGQFYKYEYEVDGTNIYRLNTLTNVTTWTGGLGSCSVVNYTNYIKTVSGNAPSNNIAFNSIGWAFLVPTWVSNVTFLNLSFVCGGLYIDGPTSGQYLSNYTYPAGDVPLNYLANHITVKGCTMRDCTASEISVSTMFKPQTGNDYWTFDSCDIGFAPAGIYCGAGFQLGTNQSRGVTGLVVSNCYIHDISMSNYPAIDGHSIGVQNNSDCSIVGNTIQRTGTAIALFAYANAIMTNNLISRNLVMDIHVNPNTDGSGIWLSAGTVGKSTGNKIYGNIIANAGIGATQNYQGAAIASSIPDYLEIDNNTTYGGRHGIYAIVNSNPAIAQVLNNIFFNPTINFIQIQGSGPPTLTVDYNLCFTNTALATPFTFVPSVIHDTHSVFSYPLLVSASPTVATDFQLRPESPAIGAGTTVGISTDFGGNSFLNPPAIGAWEKTGVPTRTMYIGTLNLPH